MSTLAGHSPLHPLHSRHSSYVSNRRRLVDAQLDAAVVGCKVLNPDRTLQYSCFMYLSILNQFLAATYFYKIFSRNRFFSRETMTWWDHNDDREVGAVKGCFFLVRRTAIEQVGLMDEAYHMYCEEIDWQWRMARAGWERWIVPGAEVIHHGAQSTSQMPAASLVQLWTSRRRLYQRYYSPAFNAILSQMVRLGLRQRIRENHRRSQRGELSPDQRAELNLALTEVIRIWQRRRPGVTRDTRQVIRDT